MLVADVMTTPALSVDRDASLEDAVALLASNRISALPVVSSDQKVVGIVSEADVLRQPLPEDPRAHLRATGPTSDADPPMSELMTSEVECATAHQDCSEVALTLAQRGWKSMPVIDDEGRLIGMVSRSDIVRALAGTDEDIAAALRSAFDQVGHPEWVAQVHHGHVTVRSGDGDAALATAATVTGVRSVRSVHVRDTLSGPTDVGSRG